MKFLTKLLPTLLFISLSVSMFSCGGDDDEEDLGNQDSIDVADLIGAWKATVGTETFYMIINSDGTGRFREEDKAVNEVDEGNFVWSCKNRYLTAVTSDGVVRQYISKLTKKIMVLISEEDESLTYYSIKVSDVPSYEDDPDNPDEPVTPNVTIKTGSAEPRAFSAKIYGEYSGTKLPELVGVQYSYSKNFPIDQIGGYYIDGQFGGFSFSATNLVDQATVYYRVCAKIDGKFIYGETKSFKTLEGTYSIDGKTYKFIKVTGLATGSFSMMQTEIPPTAQVEIDGTPIGCWNNNIKDPITAGETREFFLAFSKAAVLPRYPTPQEWMYAATGGSKSKGFKYCGSNTIDDVAWYRENSNDHARKPAQKEPNELGFYDMSGNYAEFCSSYDEDLLEEIREQYIKKFRTSLMEARAIYFDKTWRAEGGAFGGYWGSTAANCQVNSSEKVSAPANTNRFDENIYTGRLVYSRPD